jgi:hypothetical protein
MLCYAMHNSVTGTEIGPVLTSRIFLSWDLYSGLTFGTAFEPQTFRSFSRLHSSFFLRERGACASIAL